MEGGRGGKVGEASGLSEGSPADAAQPLSNEREGFTIAFVLRKHRLGLPDTRHPLLSSWQTAEK